MMEAKIKKTKEELTTIRKRARASGANFEVRVRKDLEEKNWIVDRWSNNVEFGYFEGDSCCSPLAFIPVKWKDLTLKNGKHYPSPNAQLAQAKAKWNNFTKSMMMGKGGFPDFIAFKRSNNFAELAVTIEESKDTYEPICLIGVESKINGLLTKEETEKCKWLLDKRIFSKILIARKEKIKNKIHVKYREFK